ncbi:MAG: chromosome partitioning protein ParA, partial [Roseiflexaceae bacterium]|nr:chromosome partitioning protein ParA [Roseiflexaceae bacterium]
EQKEEEARAEALRDAIERYTALEQQAAGIYAEIENHYRRIEALRRQVRTEANRARSAITRAEKLSAQVGGLSAVSLIQEARASYNQIGEVHSEADARRALERARDAYDKAERASRILEQQFTDQGSQDSLGDFIGGVLVGMLLDGHDSDDSWSGSSGRRSSGSWSGGSRSGSDWGGGGRSGGGWGSGGSSGGGWGGGRSGGGW